MLDQSNFKIENEIVITRSMHSIIYILTREKSRNIIWQKLKKT